MGGGGCPSITMGEREITVIFPEDRVHLFRGAKCLELEMGLALVTISFPEEMVESMGLIAHIMNETRWAGVNVREIFSTYTEIGILVREKESNELYRAMLRLKSQK